MMRRYQAQDFAEMERWYRAHGQEAPPQALAFPEIGYVVPGVAAGFIYRTDSRIALLEGYVTNPEATPEQRHQALEQITGALLDAAEVHGASQVIVLTKAGDISSRARALGFRSMGRYEMLSREVK